MKSNKTFTAKARVEVRFSDCDPLGIVWHGHYIKYFEDGREAFTKKYDFDYLDFYDKGYSTPLVNVNCDFKKPLVYREVAIVETTFRNTDAAKIIFDYIIYKEGSTEVICKGTTTQVFVARDTMVLSLVNPDFFAQWKKQNNL